MERGSGNVHFKEIRKKVIQYDYENGENIHFNPMHKVSFRGIKRTAPQPQDKYKSPIKLNFQKQKNSEAKENCNKFSVLIQSKGYSNCGSAHKNNQNALSFKNNVLIDSSRHRNNLNERPQLRINTDRCDSKPLLQINTQRNRVQYKATTPKNQSKLNTERSQNKQNRNMPDRSPTKLLPFKIIGQKKTTKPPTRANTQRTESEIIQQKCRLIKQKQYSTGQHPGQLSSLYKLKNKLISPLKKAQSAPEVCRNQKTSAFEHSSIMSEHDLVNMSKTNDSIDFDMSPCLY